MIGSHSSWSARLFGWISPERGRRRPGTGIAAVSATAPRQGDQPRCSGPHPPRANDEIHVITKRLIAEDRYIFPLLSEAVDQIDDRDAQRAWEVVQQQMALVPAGN